MQDLHLVGFTADFDGLIFSVRKGAKSGSYVVAVDEALLDAINEARRLAAARRGELEPAGEPPAAPTWERSGARATGGPSMLSPRQIQDRIRAGWSVDQVADEAGTSADWIWRFARPVLAELDHVVARARAGTMVKARAGRSTLPLEAAVRRNLLDRGVRPPGGVDTGWSTFLLEPGSWVVRFEYDAPAGAQRAEWLYDGTTGDLTARDRKATDLGFVGPPRTPPTPGADLEDDAPPADGGAGTDLEDDATPADGAAAPPPHGPPAAGPGKRAPRPRKPKPPPVTGVEELELVEPPRPNPPERGR
jgi:Protein of unknown function (DUF3071)